MVQKYPTVRRKRKPSDICKEIKLQQGVLVSVLSLLFHLSSERPIQPFIPSGIWPQYCMRMRGHVHLMQVQLWVVEKQVIPFKDIFHYCACSQALLQHPHYLEGAPSLFAVVGNSIFLKYENMEVPKLIL